MAAKKAATPRRTTKQAARTVTVVMKASSWKHRRGDVVEVSAGTAATLIRAGHATPSDA